jgi:uroporphyrinogen-III synthase
MALGLDPALSPSTRVAASGPATSRAVESAGWNVDCLANEGGAKALGEALTNCSNLDGSRVLLPGSDLMRPVLRDELTEAGAVVETVTVYRTIQPAPDGTALSALRSGRIDVVILASPSAVRNLTSLADRDVLASTCLVCIGNTTAGALSDRGLRAAATAKEPSAQGLLEAVLSLEGEFV